MNIFMTGGGSSVGAYMRDKLHAMGHKTFIVGLDGPDVKMDLVDMDERRADDIVDEARMMFDDHIDAALFNAGMLQVEHFTKVSENDWYRVIQVNLHASVMLTKALLDAYDERVRSVHPMRFVYTVSLAARRAMRFAASYCASKAGLSLFMKSMAREYCHLKSEMYPDRLRFAFFGVSPSIIEGSGMRLNHQESYARCTNTPLEEVKKGFVKAPIGRGCTFDEVWKVVKFALFDAPDYMTGVDLEMSGGGGF